MGAIKKSAKDVGVMDLVNGAVLQCVEAASLGMPFEVRQYCTLCF